MDIKRRRWSYVDGVLSGIVLDLVAIGLVWISIAGSWT